MKTNTINSGEMTGGEFTGGSIKTSKNRSPRKQTTTPLSSKNAFASTIGSQFDFTLKAKK